MSERNLTSAGRIAQLRTPEDPAIGQDDEGLIDANVIARLEELEVASGEPLLASLVDVFLADAPKRIAALEEARSRGDPSGVERQAHSLKGSAGALGVVHVAAVAASVEAAAKAGDLAALGDPAKRLREAITRSERALREVVARATGGRAALTP